ncbi:hypothetical protein ABW20_dc0105027 [Dactylellina cionopaga]|nr:hypothetical protein ABW20_dc0105027 [Dactylellina cionopaga]
MVKILQLTLEAITVSSASPTRLSPTFDDQGIRDIENPSSIGTTLTKVSHSASPRVLSPEKSDEDPHDHAGTTSANISDETKRKEYDLENLPWWDQKPVVPTGRSASLFANSSKFSQNGMPGSDTNWDLKAPKRVAATDPTNSDNDTQSFTTKVMVNGVPRRIPSAIKASASSQKQILGGQRESLGPPQPMPFTRTIRASAPAKFAGWHGGPPPLPPPPLSHPAPGLPRAHSPYNKQHAHPNAGGKGHSAPRFPRKFRPKQCTICGATSHLHKDCPQRGGNSKQGGFHNKQIGGGDTVTKSAIYSNSGSGKGSIFRPSEKAPGYPIERQLELVDTIVAQVRAIKLNLPMPGPMIPAPFYLG